MTPHLPSELAPTSAAPGRRTFAHWLQVDAGSSRLAAWANQFILLGIFLFALAIPHSIAAAHVALNLSALAWLLRAVTLRKLHWTATPLDWPLLAFSLLSILSACFSIEPSLSLPKLKTLLLWGTVYLLVSNLRPAAIRPWLLVLCFSAAVGALFSLADRAYGRGMIITELHPTSPLLHDQPLAARLQPGDAIWMIGRQRVYSLTDVQRVIQQKRNGETVTIEALHAGDPLPARLKITDELKATANPLGLTVKGRTHRFRVSGFGRQFLTYAEQLQMLALLCFGLVLVGCGTSSAQRHWRWASGLGFALFTLALVLTASRAVIASFLITALLLAIISGGRRAMLAALPAAFLLGAFSVYVLTTARQAETLNLSDDSAQRRLAYMRAGLRVIPRHPLLGAGADAHTKHWQEWGFPGEYVTHTHSTPIQLAMDRGLPALACYLWLVIAMLQLTWRNYRRWLNAGNASMAGIGLGVLGALVAVTLSSLANYNFGDSEVLLLLLGLVSMAIVSQQQEQALKSETTP